MTRAASKPDSAEARTAAESRREVRLDRLRSALGVIRGVVVSMPDEEIPHKLDQAEKHLEAAIVQIERDEVIQ